MYKLSNRFEDVVFWIFLIYKLNENLNLKNTNYFENKNKLDNYISEIFGSLCCAWTYVYLFITQYLYHLLKNNYQIQI